MIELVPLGEVLAGGGDDLDEEERAALHAELEFLISRRARRQSTTQKHVAMCCRSARHS